ncbi:MetQ/NlpA family ABC transporter substrate-binding protein [Camelimonas abortus]|uniref:MetQ/NlpA family ABC transporter substrate-binding protein n=1 Tax=Camelimonas abortus TaxID=1017184 RepID=A0ABV7LEV9_9HYPH
MTVAAAAVGVGVGVGAAAAGEGAPAVIRVGVVPGPDVKIVEQVKKVAAQRGLNVELVQFSDYVIPNQALASGDIEANAFQHEPYLRNQIASTGWKLVRAGDTIISPMGAYSARHRSLDAVPAGGTVALPNDPTNGGRALKLLAGRGLIGLKEGRGASATVHDVTVNPKQLKFVELDAAQIARSLPDVDLAVINSNYAVEAGLDPLGGALVREDVNGPWVNIIAVREADLGKPWVKELVAAYQSEPVRAFILGKYRGVYVPAW